MTWVGVAIGGGALLGGIVASQGAQSAASTQAGAAENAQQISQNEFNTITGQEQPFMNLGYGAGGELGYLLGLPGYQNFGQAGTPEGPSPVGGSLTGAMRPGGGGRMFPNSFQGNPGQFSSLFGSGGGVSATGGPALRPGQGQPSGPGGNPAGGFGSLVTPFTTQNWQQLSPMYNFNVQQGRQGVLNADATGQGALSGSAAKDLINYNQSAANNSFGQAFNQYQTQQGNIFSRLSGIAQLGQNAAANTGLQGTALAGQAAQSATNIGTAEAAGQIGQANAWSGAIGTASAVPWLMAHQQNPDPSANGPG